MMPLAKSISKQSIILIVNYAPDGQESMRQYGDWLADLLEDNGLTVEKWMPPIVFSRGRPTRNGWSKFLGYLDKYMLAPLAFRKRWKSVRSRGDTPPIVHILDHSNVMYQRCFKGANVLVTVHDLIAIERAKGLSPVAPPKWSGRLQQRWILSGLKRVQVPVFVSDATRRTFEALTGRSVPDAPVVHNALVGIWAPVAKEEAERRCSAAGIALPEAYLYHHGNNSWYKNRDQVLRVFSFVKAGHPNVGLVLSSARLSPKQREWLEAHDLADSVIEAGRVSDEVLRALYSHAAVFLFPSWTEGFGWPPLEAQACACPVVASTGGSLPEVLGNSALLHAPDNTAALAGAVLAVLEDAPTRKDLIEAGKRNVERFQHEKIAAQYLELYRSRH